MHDFSHISAEHSRERQLWCAVIGRAVLDATRPFGPSGQTPEQARARAEAWRWFMDNDEDYRKACEAAGFDPDFLRARVLRLGENGATSAIPAAVASAGF
jgi:hypothetical protein